MIALENDRACSRMIAQSRLTPLAAAVALCFAGHAAAATITVNDATAGSVSTSCTIVDAVTAVNTLAPVNQCAAGNGSGDTIVIAPGLAPIDFVTPTTPNSALVLSRPVIISGSIDSNGKPLTVIERDASAASFRLIETSTTFSMTGVTVRNGIAPANGNGGGIDVTQAGNVTIANSVISGNTAPSGKGGGIFTQNGIIVVNDSTVSGNSARNGGALRSYENNIALTNSTISGNSATAGSGGGMYAGFSSVIPGLVTATNTTFGGNAASGSGGAIFTYGSVSLSYCTLAQNRAGARGGGVLVGSSSSSATFQTTLMHGNSPNDIDSLYSIALGGDHDLIIAPAANVTVPPGTLACNPNLGPLFDNGGATMTYPLFAGSCALDAGPASPAVATDQRDLQRPVGGASDIGAFEKQGPLDPPDLIFVNGFDP